MPGYPGRSEPDRTRYIGSYRVRYSQDGLTWIWVSNRSGRLKVFPGHSQVSLLQTAADHPGLGPEAVGGKTAAGRLTWNDVKDIRHNTFVFLFVGFKPFWSALAIAGVWDVCRGRHWSWYWRSLGWRPDHREPPRAQRHWQASHPETATGGSESAIYPVGDVHPGLE